jgi:hypothetical protein
VLDLTDVAERPIVERRVSERRFGERRVGEREISAADFFRGCLRAESGAMRTSFKGLTVPTTDTSEFGPA